MYEYICVCGGLRLQFLTLADRWQPTPLGWVSRYTVENRLTQQLVATQTGIVQGLSSLEVELGGAGDPIGGGSWMTAGLECLSWSKEEKQFRQTLRNIILCKLC